VGCDEEIKLAMETKVKAKGYLVVEPRYKFIITFFHYISRKYLGSLPKKPYIFVEVEAGTEEELEACYPQFPTSRSYWLGEGRRVCLEEILR